MMMNRQRRQRQQRSRESSTANITINDNNTTTTTVPKWQKQKSFICPLSGSENIVLGNHRHRDHHGPSPPSLPSSAFFNSSSTTNLYSRKRYDETSTYEKLLWYLSHSNQHQLEELIFRGGSGSGGGGSGGITTSSSSRIRTGSTSGSNLLLLGSSTNDSISVPVIMLSRIQELIHTRKYWKKIELSGRGGDSSSSRSAAYILETLHSRHVLVPTGGINNYRGGKERRLAKAVKTASMKIGTSTTTTTTTTTTMVIDKLVLEHATPLMMQELRKLLRYSYTVKIKCLVFRYTSFFKSAANQRTTNNNSNESLTKSLILSVMGYHHHHSNSQNRKLTSFKSSPSSSKSSPRLGSSSTGTVESLIITGSTFEESASHDTDSAINSTNTAIFSTNNSQSTTIPEDSFAQQEQGRQQSAIQEVVDALRFCRDHRRHGQDYSDDDDDDDDKNNKETSTASLFPTTVRNQPHKLRELCISDCHLEDTEIEAVVEALIPAGGKQQQGQGLRSDSSSPSLMLESLDISNNYCQAKGIKAVSKLIGFGFLRHLNLSNQDCWDDRSYMMPLWDAILRGNNGNDASFSSLETLDLSDNFLHDGNMKELFQHECVVSPSSSLSSSNIGRHTCLRKLILRGNNFTDDVLVVLAKSLPYMMVRFPNLSWIDLRRNQKMTPGRNASNNALTQSLNKLGSCMINSIDPTSSPPSSLSSSFLRHLFLDDPTPELLLQLALYRAGIWRGRGGNLEKSKVEKDNVNCEEADPINHPKKNNQSDAPELQTIPHKIWPRILERCMRCIPSSKADNEVDSLMAMNNISPADCIYRLLPHFVATMAAE